MARQLTGEEFEMFINALALQDAIDDVNLDWANMTEEERVEAIVRSWDAHMEIQDD